MEIRVRSRHLVWMLVLGVLFAFPSAADIFVYTGVLNGAQEVPPRATPATGFGRATLDTAALTLDVSLSWEDLLAPASAAHIHCCNGPGVNSPVAIDFVPAGVPALTTGVFNHVFDLDDPSSYGAGFLGSFGGDVDAARAVVIAGLNGADAYFNIHTSVFLPGEIRGNIAPVPEPSSLILLGSLLGGGVLWRRFRSAHRNR